MSIKAVAFDAFGTICRIEDRRNPYGKLFRQMGVDKANAVKQALTQSLGLPELAVMLAAQNPDSRIADLLPAVLGDLADEIRSIVAYSEALTVMENLRRHDCKIAVVSNLAEPYGPTVKNLFAGHVDHFVFSFAVGAAKPDAAIFQSLCDALKLAPHEILMVGDSEKNDYEGALAFGLSALRLDRSAGGKTKYPTVSDLLGVLDYLRLAESK